ncbi:MAG: c-type cytochrome [Flavisolibacter sp.]
MSELFASRRKTYIQSFHQPYNEDKLWQPPSEDEIPSDAGGDLIRYGKELIVNTSKYLGPRGIVTPVANNMNCQNCHLAAGTQNFANPFSAVSSTYPKYRERSGRVESVEFRVNDCLQRSLDGKTLDSVSPEMRAMVAYLKWISKDVPKGLKPKGGGTTALPFLNRAADPQKGKLVFTNICQRCHGANGEGVLAADSAGYVYPPLWGNNSYNVGAGMYTLSRLAGFVKNNMPFGTTWRNPQLTNEQAWDVAAFISSQQRPEKTFMNDWPDISKKPVDYPFGPYVDSFSAMQHKYGPFLPIAKK